MQITEEAGFLINFDKSHLEPNQQMVYLGVHLDLKTNMAKPSEERISDVLRVIREICAKSRICALDLVSLLGLLNSCKRIVPQARLRLRPLQLYLLCHWRPSTDDIEKMIPVKQPLKEHLSWWTRETLSQGVYLGEEVASVVLTTDASNAGWGGYLEAHTAQGTWSVVESKFHINLLEMLGVWNSLKHLLPHVRNRKVLIRSDNFAVVTYINKEGGTKSPKLCMMVWQMLMWCQTQNMRLHAQHIAGLSNRMADLLSRKRVAPTEWSLHTAVVETVFAIMGRPHIDLFASEENRKLPIFCTWQRSEVALAMDALSISWNGFLGYAFPPFALLHKVLEKVRHHTCKVILIAPAWPKRAWYVQILRHLAGQPVLLPCREDLLSQNRGRILHPEPEFLRLAAWPVSGVDSEIKDFRRRLQNLSQRPSEEEPGRFTKEDSENLLAGVVEGKKILFRQI
jgi:hypothetical protein